MPTSDSWIPENALTDLKKKKRVLATVANNQQEDIARAGKYSRGGFDGSEVRSSCPGKQLQSVLIPNIK